MREAVASSSQSSFLTLEVDGHTLDIARSLGEIDLDNLTREVQDIGGHVIWWGVMYARALGAARRAKRQARIVAATQARSIRERASLPTTTKERLTEKALEELVTLDAAVQTAEDEQIRADERADVLRAVSMSLEEKQRTLRALTGALARELDAGAPGDVLRDRMRAHVDDLRDGARGRHA